jgi:hypothetical protein
MHSNNFAPDRIHDSTATDAVDRIDQGDGDQVRTVAAGRPCGAVETFHEIRVSIERDAFGFPVGSDAGRPPAFLCFGDFTLSRVNEAQDGARRSVARRARCIASASGISGD